jgi:hypothetical protein
MSTTTSSVDEDSFFLLTEYRMGGVTTRAFIFTGKFEPNGATVVDRKFKRCMNEGTR